MNYRSNPWQQAPDHRQTKAHTDKQDRQPDDCKTRKDSKLHNKTRHKH